MDLEQLELVLRAQQRLADPGRSGVDAQVLALVEAAHLLQVVLHQLGHRLAAGLGGLDGGQQAEDAGIGLGRLARVVLVQAIDARASVGVDHGEAGVFLTHVLQDGDQRHVLEHVGVVARVEGVAVTEHGADGNARGRQPEMKNGPAGPFSERCRLGLVDQRITASWARAPFLKV